MDYGNFPENLILHYQIHGGEKIKLLTVQFLY